MVDSPCAQQTVRQQTHGVSTNTLWFLVPKPSIPALWPSSRKIERPLLQSYPTQWIATHETAHQKNPLKPRRPTRGPSGKKKGADRRKPKAQRSALIALSSNPDKLRATKPAYLMRRQLLKADIPHAGDFRISSPSYSPPHSHTCITSSTHEAGTPGMNSGTALCPAHPGSHSKDKCGYSTLCQFSPRRNWKIPMVRERSTSRCLRRPLGEDRCQLNSQNVTTCFYYQISYLYICYAIPPGNTPLRSKS